MCTNKELFLNNIQSTPLVAQSFALSSPLPLSIFSFGILEKVEDNGKEKRVYYFFYNLL